MNEAKREKLLRELENEVIGLKNSPLYAERIKNNALPVIGEGSIYASIMFIGEAPGKNEAKTGKPFCGTAGKILTTLLDSVGMKREEVYITNIVKDRPPLNRDPEPEEIALYAPFLDQQIDLIQPKVIATLGRFSMVYIMEKFGLAAKLKPISELHGKVFEAVTSYGRVTIIPLYHPAASIYNQKLKQILKNDFEILKNFK